MKKTIFTLLTLLLLIPNTFSVAQYTQNDSALVKTTFLREFDKNIIYDYLSSKDSNKINAALLSMSHSEDTTFVDSIIKLNYYNYGDYIPFALGQLGESKKSEKYLLDILDSTSVPFENLLFEAIGKIGDSLTLEYLFDSVINDSSYNLSGFPLALTNFYNRRVNNINTLPYLIKQIDQPEISEDELFQVLYSLYRIGPSKDVLPKLIQILNENYAHNIIQYALNNLRKLKFFPDDLELMSVMANSESWNIKCEAASVLCYFPFQSFSDLKVYLSLIDDKNPNVSRNTATSLKNIGLKNAFSDSLKTYLEKTLKENRLTINTQGELFISYCSLYPQKLEDKVDEYEEHLNVKFIYNALTNNINDVDYNYDYLTDRIDESNEVELLNLLPALLALQNRLLNEDEYAGLILKIMNGDKPSSISIICDGLKLPFIHHYQDMLPEIIIDQVFKYQNNPQYVETIFSLSNLASRVNENLHFTVIEILSKSKLYSIQKYVSQELGNEIPSKKETARLNEILKNSFKYKTAKIETEKGIITILLKPNFAPITVGSFVSLVEQNYYDGVLFHRVVPDFIIQTGDTTGTGWSGPGYEIISEFSPRAFVKGAVGMASVGKDTEGSQWFIMHSNFPHLNGRYTNWAEVIEGQDVVDIIDEDDKIISIIFLE